MAYELRPLTLPELLDRAFILYKRHLWLFVGIMAVPSSFGLATSLIAQALQLIPRRATTGHAPDVAYFFSVVLPLFAGMLALGIAYFVVYTFALGATTAAVSEIYLDRVATIADAYRRVRPHGGRLVLLLIWFGLRVGGLFVGGFLVVGATAALIVPASPIAGGLVALFTGLAVLVLCGWLSVRYGLAVPALVLEHRTAGKSLGRSVELTRGHRGRVFLLWVCAIVIAYATVAIFQAPFMVSAAMVGATTTAAAWLRICGAVFGAIGGMFSGPIMIIGLVVLYYDARIRKEAFDLQTMLDAIETPSPQSAPLA